MTTLTATPDPLTGSVALNLTQTSVVTGVVRSDSTGVYDVRSAAGQFPTPASGTTLLTDYEARHGLNTYTAYADDISYRQNLCTNPSFEVDTSGWSLSGVTAIVSSGFPQMVKSGTRIAQATSTGTSASPYMAMLNVPVSEGQWFAFKAFLASEFAGNIQVRIAITFLDASDAGLLTMGTTYAKASFYTGAYHQIVTEAPAGTAKATIFLQFRNGDATGSPVASGQRLWADVVQVHTADTQANAQTMLNAGYFDGSTADDDDNDYVWLGTAHASQSVHTQHVREIVATADLQLETPWLVVPVAPNFSEQVETITNYSAGRETSSTVHKIIGRSDPLVVFGKLGTRTGTLEIWADSVADAERIVRVFDRGEAVLLKQRVAGMDLYLVAESLDIAPYSVAGPDDTRYRLAIQYREVTQPLGNLAGALGWTFDSLATAFPSFNTAAQAFENFDAMTINERL